MPYCPQCGVENPASARYCDQCGATLVPTTGAAPVTQAQPQPAPAVAAPGATSCAQCGAAAIPGEAFCDNCGAPLLPAARPATPAYGGGVAPQPVYPPPQPASPPPVAAPPSYTGVATPVTPQPPPTPRTPPPPAQRTSLAPARLVLEQGGAVLPLPSGSQALVGRADPVSQFFPEIDLTAHGALDNGVGRRHARLLLANGQIALEDLDSTNGTFLNGQKLPPRQPQPVRDGDQIQFGKMRLRIQL